MQQSTRFFTSAVALATTSIVSIFLGLTNAAYAALVMPKSADAFVDSMCVGTHFNNGKTPYVKRYNTVKEKLLSLGIGHIRDGGSSNSLIAKLKDLAASGVKTTYIMNPADGIAPNSSYWVSFPYYYINDFVKNKVGINVIDAVEVFNEIDVFYKLGNGYYWHPGDTEKLNNDPLSPFYWVSYTRSATKDTWTALKSDPDTAAVKVLGPSLGVTYNYKNKSPLGDLSNYVDWGNIHPYAVGGNPFSNPFSYGTIDKYYWYGNFPSINIDEFPFVLDVYAPPFGSQPLAVTETGYFTGTASKSVSEKVHGKYIPRLFLEYFRKGIVRTCYYEFVDEYQDLSNSKANYGLLRNDLTPKPAFTALRNIINLLKDPGPSFTLSSLDYTLTVNPPPEYNRTQYVHSLLLQKRNGDYYLVLWHEISNNDTSSSPSREITPPPIPTQLTLNTPVSSNATVYTLSDSGFLYTSTVTTSNNTLTLKVKDKAMFIKLTPLQ